MGRAYRLNGNEYSAVYFLDHFTHAAVLRAMDGFGMIQDLDVLRLAETAFDSAFREGRPVDDSATKALVEALREAGAAEPAGIPRHKLSTGEGWLITPREITAALNAYQQAPRDERAAAVARIDDWGGWIDFLHTAGDFLGLRSH
ncbi:hypothetical protein F4556_005077 [Kitasatospora gansuensis]|uniref:Uncharacterized protein n=1 Tax=Kitasatospora gansuensis TaxID=258050 RepID=A0A7W7WJ68_9ACTN|nr:hypothetical protein [Kitasatospora gansuensis]MBB4949542.1 hypothetical protein [Kitasatospora gansuensis]